MRKIICSILAGSIFFAACSKTSSRKEPGATTPAKKEELTQTNQNINAEAAKVDQSENGANSQAFSLASAALNAAVQKMMANKELFIKDANGNNITDIDTYRLNPTQYILVFKNENVANGYYVLKTKTSDVTAASSQVDIGFDVYTGTGDMNAVKVATLGAAKMSDSLTLYNSPLRILDNKANIDALIKRVEGSKITANSSILKAISDFLVPTATASTYEHKLMTTAIVFSCIAIVSYIFNWRWIGAVTTAGSIVFWLLHFFETHP